MYLEDGVHLPSFHAALNGEAYSVGAEEGLRTLKPGHARGTLYGGCSRILVALLGTPWEPQTEDKLLFLEDMGTKPYQVDRMLWQLRKAGKLEACAASSSAKCWIAFHPAQRRSCLNEVDSERA